MEKIIFNSLLKCTQKPNNPHLWFNILSAEKTKKKMPRQEYNKFLKKQTSFYVEVDDYIIEYKLVFGDANGNKQKLENFIYHAYLSEFANKEQSFINQLIKIRSAVIKSSATTVVAETTIV